jgi:glycosyltransferase involved in cell wall biosynthesis
MAQHHDVWVLTRGRYRDLIEEAMRREPVAGLHFVYLDLPDWFLRRTKPSHSFQLFYYLWQFGAYFVARRLCREVGIDLIHHVTYSRYWAPSFVSLLPVPFVWGPVGGGETMPRGFVRRYSFSGRLYERLRDWARRIGEHDPFVKLTARRSAVALATTAESAMRMRALGARSVEVYPAIGLTQEDLDVFDSVKSSERNVVRFLSIGRLLHWKGFDLGIKAFAVANLADAEFCIIGEGPERKRLQALAAVLGIESQIRFLGERSREETLKVIGESDVLVHPSLHESGGLVCLEAMAARRPVLCLDWGGPAVQVADGTGIRVSVRDATQVITDLGVAMKLLAGNAALRKRMGRLGREHVESHYFWPKKVAYYHSLYEAAVSGKKREGTNASESLQKGAD